MFLGRCKILFLLQSSLNWNLYIGCNRNRNLTVIFFTVQQSLHLCVGSFFLYEGSIFDRCSYNHDALFITLYGERVTRACISSFLVYLQCVFKHLEQFTVPKQDYASVYDYPNKTFASCVFSRKSFQTKSLYEICFNVHRVQDNPLKCIAKVISFLIKFFIKNSCSFTFYVFRQYILTQRARKKNGAKKAKVT